MSNLNERTGPSLSLAELKATDGVLATWGVFTLLELGGGLNFLPENALQAVSKLGVKITIGNRGLQWPRAAEYTYPSYFKMRTFGFVFYTVSRLLRIAIRTGYFSPQKSRYRVKYFAKNPHFEVRGV